MLKMGDGDHLKREFLHFNVPTSNGVTEITHGLGSRDVVFKCWKLEGAGNNKYYTTLRSPMHTVVDESTIHLRVEAGDYKAEIVG